MGYQRKLWPMLKKLEATDEQLEYLVKMGIDQMDLPQIIQDKYDEHYLSQVIVTGNISIVV